MKKLVVLVSLICSMNVLGQLAPVRSKVNLNLPQPEFFKPDKERMVGPYMMLGGLTFMVAGLLTPPIMVGGSTTQQQAMYKQARSFAFTSGVLTFGAGVVLTIKGR